jgi:predicted PurR-regulated permease PerM
MQEPNRSPSPVEVHDPLVRDSLKQAAVWLGLAALLFLLWRLGSALLLVFGGLVFAALLDLGSRSLGRVWNGPQGVRLTLVVLFIVLLLAGFLTLAGVQLAEQAGALSQTLTAQVKRLSQLLESFGIASIAGNEGRGPLAGIASQIVGSFDKLTQALGGAVGAIGSLLLIMVLGIYVAAEPRLYERGVEWLTPMHARRSIAEFVQAAAETLRRWTLGRLIAMAFDGIFTTVALLLAGVPLAPLLGLIAGVLAFIPNIGAFIAGTLIVLVGFSAGTETGLLALGIYLALQLIEGNLISPMVERRAVDVAPAVTLAAQLLFGAVFGLLGVALAVPIVAVIKVALEHHRTSAQRHPAGNEKQWTTPNDLESSAPPR